MVTIQKTLILILVELTQMRIEKKNEDKKIRIIEKHDKKTVISS